MTDEHSAQPQESQQTADSAAELQRGEVFVISVAAKLAGMHAQTLRTYDRLGLVTPQRTRGGGRRYSPRDVELLREVQRLSQDEGVNLEGIRRIIELTEQVEQLQDELASTRQELEAERTRRRSSSGELVHVPRSQAVVVWRRDRSRRA